MEEKQGHTDPVETLRLARRHSLAQGDMFFDARVIPWVGAVELRGGGQGDYFLMSLSFHG